MNIQTNHIHLLGVNRTAFLVMGCIEASWAPMVPYIKDAYGLDEGQLGMLLLCSGVGTVTGLAMSARCCSSGAVRKRRRRCNGFDTNPLPRGGGKNKMFAKRAQKANKSKQNIANWVQMAQFAR